MTKSSLEAIRSKVKRLYDTNPEIRVNVSISRPRVHLENEPATIKSVYPHFFQIEEHSGGSLRIHTIQYIDLVTRQIEIVEPDTTNE